MADALLKPQQQEQRIVSYTQWQRAWSLVQECEMLAQHRRAQVCGLRRALRTHALDGAERAKYQTVLREAVRGRHQACSTLTALKTRLLWRCTVCGPDIH